MLEGGADAPLQHFPGQGAAQREPQPGHAAGQFVQHRRGLGKMAVAVGGYVGEKMGRHRGGSIPEALMGTRQESFADFVLDQLSELEGASARRMFGGHGLYRGGDFFGIIHDGRGNL